MTDRASSDAFLTQAAFARRLGVSRQRIATLKKAGMPIGDDGLIDVAAGMNWIKSNISPRHGSQAARDAKPEGHVDLTEARRLKVLADTQMTHLIIAKESVALVDREQTRRALAAFSRLVRDKWVDFGNRYGQQVAAAIGADPKLVMAEIDKAVRLQLDEIANVQAPL